MWGDGGGSPQGERHCGFIYAPPTVAVPAFSPHRVHLVLHILHLVGADHRGTLLQGEGGGRMGFRRGREEVQYPCPAPKSGAAPSARRPHRAVGRAQRGLHTPLLVSATRHGRNLFEGARGREGHIKTAAHHAGVVQEKRSFPLLTVGGAAPPTPRTYPLGRLVEGRPFPQAGRQRQLLVLLRSGSAGQTRVEDAVYKTQGPQTYLISRIPLTFPM